MCIFGNSQSENKPTPPPVAPAPTAASVVADVTNPAADAAAASEKAKTALEQNRTLIAKRQGVFGNIRTSAQGDAGYGFSTSSLGGRVAAFGAGRKKAA